MPASTVSMAFVQNDIIRVLVLMYVIKNFTAICKFKDQLIY